MSILLIDHTFGPWLARKRQENGASTYSEDLCTAIIPELWDYLEANHSGKDILISTAPPLAQVDPAYLHTKKPDLVIQFLHTYPYRSPFDDIQRLLDRFPHSRILLVTAYQAFLHRLQRWIHGKGKSEWVAAHFQPMFILPRKLTALSQNPVCEYLAAEKRIVYFGNLYKGKSTEYHRIKQGLANAGWKLDVISRSQFNGAGKVLDREEIWKIISRYRYGIGVGRCALEMYALGLQLLISGEHWGGLCLVPEDYQTQSRTNFNGRVITGTRDLEEALELLPISHWQAPSFSDQANTNGLIRKVENMFKI